MNTKEKIMNTYAVIEEGKVINICIAEESDIKPNNWIPCTNASIGWLYNGQTFTEPAPETKSPKEIQDEIITATQQRLDDFARTRNYDSILSACTYAASTNATFAAEGQRAVRLRDDTWQALYNILGQIATQGRVVNSYDDIDGDLPALTWA